MPDVIPIRTHRGGPDIPSLIFAGTGVFGTSASLGGAVAVSLANEVEVAAVRTLIELTPFVSETPSTGMSLDEYLDYDEPVSIVGTVRMGARRVDVVEDDWDSW